MEAYKAAAAANDQCILHPDCVRGYKHHGGKGPCRIRPEEAAERRKLMEEREVIACAIGRMACE